jgi:hypothetical protein
MSADTKRLEQILESTFGLAFLAHLTGIEPFEILTCSTNASEISRRARDFKLDSRESSIFDAFAEFIRDYPYGLAHDWIRLGKELSEARQDLARVLTEITEELLAFGFVASFDASKQYSVPSDSYSHSKNSDFVTLWKPNLDAWWSHPNTLPSFQANSEHLSSFAFDDAIILPTSMAKLEVPTSAKIYEIHDVQDWLSLVDRFATDAKILHLDNWGLSEDPAHESTWIPDWRKVAGEFDGVYLSPAAYLGVSYSLIELEDGRATFLSGWSPGATFWLPQHQENSSSN